MVWRARRFPRRVEFSRESRKAHALGRCDTQCVCPQRYEELLFRTAREINFSFGRFVRNPTDLSVPPRVIDRAAPKAHEPSRITQARALPRPIVALLLRRTGWRRHARWPHSRRRRRPPSSHHRRHAHRHTRWRRHAWRPHARRRRHADRRTATSGRRRHPRRHAWRRRPSSTRWRRHPSPLRSHLCC